MASSAPHCHACGETNGADRLHCSRCGGRLGDGCAARGAANRPGERFCGKCGPSLTGATAHPAAPASVAEGRYQVRRLPGEEAPTRPGDPRSPHSRGAAMGGVRLWLKRQWTPAARPGGCTWSRRTGNRGATDRRRMPRQGGEDPRQHEVVGRAAEGGLPGVEVRREAIVGVRHAPLLPCPTRARTTLRLRGSHRVRRGRSTANVRHRRRA
jgi:hypothetical protein